jgi:hypothetical protein
MQGLRAGTSSSRTEVQQTEPDAKCVHKLCRSCNTNGAPCLAAVTFGLGLKLSFKTRIGKRLLLTFIWQ